jgi:hypothetical protein
VIEPVRSQLDKPRGEPDSRFVGEPAEHHVRHLFELVAHRRVQDRVPVAVHDAPPRRHPIDQLTSVHESQTDTGGRRDRQRGRWSRRRAIGMPDVPLIELREGREFHSAGSLRREEG